MTEGELRTLIAEAIREGAQAWSDANAAAGHAVAPYSDYVADRVLAVLRPHLGLGVTDKERVVIQRFLDVTRTEVSFEIVNAVKPTLRAIAGRGEGVSGGDGA